MSSQQLRSQRCCWIIHRLIPQHQLNLTFQRCNKFFLLPGLNLFPACHMAQMSATREIWVALNTVRNLTFQMVESGQQSLNCLRNHGAELRWNRIKCRVHVQCGHCSHSMQTGCGLFRSGNTDRNKTPLENAEALNQYIWISFVPKQFDFFWHTSGSTSCLVYTYLCINRF